MVMLDHLNGFPEATRLFIIRRASEGNPLAAAIIDLELASDQMSPALTDSEQEYLLAAASILKQKGLLLPAAEALIAAPQPAVPQFIAPAVIPPAAARPHPAAPIASTIPARAQAPVRINNAPFMSNAPTRLAPSAHQALPYSMSSGAGAGPSTSVAPSRPAPQAVVAPAPNQNVEIQEDDGEIEEETEDAANTYSSYVAKNIREIFPEISAHPDPLVETASLASVQLPTLDEDTKIMVQDLHKDVEKGHLSDAQMESIIYAWKKFTGPRLPGGKRRGFFLGDGAGVGKGRTIAGLVKQHYNNEEGGKHILWVSVSQDLRRDAARDLEDIKAGIKIYEGKGNALIPEGNFQGVVFITYSLLRSGLPSAPPKKRKKNNVAGGSRVAQLQAMAAGGMSSGGSASESENGDDDDEDDDSTSFEITNLPERARLAQVIKWLRRAGENGPLIIFDESHRAKNLLLSKDAKGGRATQTARAVVHLQEEFPNAKILYSSATGASEPHNLAYMTRLWGSEQTSEMVKLLCNAKLGALELAAISLKATGTYLARTLSYTDAEFHLEKVQITPDFDLMYERSTNFWTLLYRVMEYLAKMEIVNNRWRGQFWGAHQRFYRSMLMASKVKKCAELSRAAVAQGMSVVIGLQSTGEAVTEQLRDISARSNEGSDEFDDLVSAPRQILDSFIRNFFPIGAAPYASAGLEALEYQVWEAVNMWKNMPSVDELAAITPATAGISNAGGVTDAPAGVAAAAGGGATTAAAVREAVITGENIKIERVITDQERIQLSVEADRLSRHLTHSSITRQENARNRRDEQECTRAKQALDIINKYKKRVLDALEIKKGAAGPSTAAAAAAAHRATSNAVTFIDLTGDSDEDEDQQNTAPAQANNANANTTTDASGCSRCEQEPDIAMATCTKCHVIKAHIACLDSDETSESFKCDDCTMKQHQIKSEDDDGRSRAGAGAVGSGLIKKEPGTGMAATTTTNGGGGAVVSDAELASKTVAELRALLKSADVKISEAERKLAIEVNKLDTIKNEKAAEDMIARARVNNPMNQRRSKAGKQAALEAAAQVKAEQGLRSAVVHPPCVTTTTRTDAIENYRSTTERPREQLDAVPDEYPSAEDQRPNGSLTRIREWLLLLVEAGLDLPHNPIDKLIEDCGGEHKVAELTGRRGFIKLDQNKETARYKLRDDGKGPARELNLREKDKFMDGTKRIAIISDAASTGISLQADKRVASHKFRRLHLTLELPWSADKAVQQFGRSHRANQHSAPVYKILVTPCGGEYRFASAAAKRLQSLGALLRGDRNAVGAGAELKAFDVDTSPGHIALQRMLRFITSEDLVMPGVKVPDLPDNLKLSYGFPIGNSDDESAHSDSDSESDPNRNTFGEHPLKKPFFIHFCRRLFNLGLLTPDSNNNKSGYVSKKTKLTQFLNRLLGLPIEEQDILFKFFSDTLDATITNLKSLGKYDNGIMSLQGRSITKKSEEVVINDPVSGVCVKHVTVSLSQGVTFEEAQTMIEEAKQRITELTDGARPSANQLSGFYVQRSQTWTLSGLVYPRIELALEVADNVAYLGETDFINMREVPPYGQDFPKLRKMRVIRNKGWCRITNLDEAKQIWDAWFNHTATGCVHGDNCNKYYGHCKEGRRHVDKHMLCGAVLDYWSRLEQLHIHSGYARTYRRTTQIYDENGHSEETEVTVTEPLYVGRAITKVPGDEELSGEPIVGILAESQEEMEFLKQHMVPPSNDPTYQDPLVRALGTNHRDPNAIRGLNAGSDPFIRRGNGSGGASGSGSRSGKPPKKPKNFR